MYKRCGIKLICLRYAMCHLMLFSKEDPLIGNMGPLYLLILGFFKLKLFRRKKKKISIT